MNKPNYYDLIEILKEYRDNERTCTIILNQELCTIDGYISTDDKLNKLHEALQKNNFFIYGTEDHRVYIYAFNKGIMHGILRTIYGDIVLQSIEEFEGLE